ncbi:MAG: tRNA (N6-threonylcarbamoyladenosine(37)-N6)-methyltransferase TrmO [Candidatus Bathyarchaeota archaeon]|jgi:tRNA-Thr(GGU) m(6)t(6)A37 methyltransferase TsaA
MVEDKGEVRFIGVVESAGDPSRIRVYPEFCQALLGIEGYSHLIVLYWFHLRDDEGHRRTLRVTPPRHDGAPLTGVFACRSPSRPNPIGLTVVELEGVDRCKLEVSGLDAFEGSPVVDIKPYSPRGDMVPEAETPDWSGRGPPT